MRKSKWKKCLTAYIGRIGPTVDRGGYPVPIGGGTIPPANGVDGMSTLAVFDGTSSSALHTKLSENIKQFLVKKK
jgi:hypothetical protein